MPASPISGCTLRFPAPLGNVQITLPEGSIDSTHIDPDAPLDADKLEHAFRHYTGFGLALTATPVNRVEKAFRVMDAAVLRQFRASLADTGTNTDLNILLKRVRAGVTTTLSTLNFSDADNDGDVKSGVISDAVLQADDLLLLEVAVTDSTGAQGPEAMVEWTELLS